MGRPGGMRGGAGGRLEGGSEIGRFEIGGLRSALWNSALGLTRRACLRQGRRIQSLRAFAGFEAARRNEQGRWGEI